MWQRGSPLSPGKEPELCIQVGWGPKKKKKQVKNRLLILRSKNWTFDLLNVEIILNLGQCSSEQRNLIFNLLLNVTMGVTVIVTLSTEAVTVFGRVDTYPPK